MKNKVQKYWVIMMAIFILSACVATTSIKHGSLEKDIYHSSTNEFSISIPVGAAIYDGKHPLGGFMSIKNLPEPTIERGVAYYRVAQPETKLVIKAEKGIIEAGYNDWLKNYASRETKNILYKEWLEIDGAPAYFTVIEGSGSGLLVKPSAYYGTISFVRENYSYVLYEIIDAPYQLKGNADSPETMSIKDSKKRLISIRKYFDSIKFTQNTSTKLPK